MVIESEPPNDFEQAVEEACHALEEGHSSEVDIDTESALTDLIKIIADNSTEYELRSDASRILILLAEEFPDELNPVTSSQKSVILATDSKFQERLLLALGHITASEPTKMNFEAGELFDLLDSQDPDVVRNLLWCLKNIAENDPSEIEPVIPEIIELLKHDNVDIQRHAVQIIKYIAEDQPESALEAIPAVFELLESTNLYRSAGRTLINMVPHADSQIIDGLFARFDSGNPILKEHISWMLVPLAEAYSSVLHPKWPILMDTLKEDDDYQVQNNTAAALSALGKANPYSGIIDELVCLLEHDDMFVRRYVCLALGDIAIANPNEELIDALLRATEDEADLVSSEAREILQSLGMSKIEQITGLDPNDIKL